MPKSRKDPKRTKNLKTYKNKKRTMNQQSLPEVRNIPVWKSTDIIPVTGQEFEAIHNSFSQLQLGLAALQSVVSRNLVDGPITMDFQKLNPQTLQYEDMAPDEKAKYTAEFAELVEAFKKERAGSGSTVSTDGSPAPSGLVSETGEPISSATIVQEERKPQAKVVSINSNGDKASKEATPAE